VANVRQVSRSLFVFFREELSERGLVDVARFLEEAGVCRDAIRMFAAAPSLVRGAMRFRVRATSRVRFASGPEESRARGKGIRRCGICASRRGRCVGGSSGRGPRWIRRA